MTAVNKVTPDFNLSEKDVTYALEEGLLVFRRCNIHASPVPGSPVRTMLLGRMGGKKFLLYVRVTHNLKGDDVGEIPPVVSAKARELQAEPHIIRLDLNYGETGVGFGHYGDDAFLNVLKSCDGWNAHLLRGKTVHDYLRLVGKVNELELRLERDTMPDNDTDPPRAIQTINLHLVVDGERVQTVPFYGIHLLGTVFRNDEHFFLTCGCGSVGCAGIGRGIVVVSDKGLTVWKGYSFRPRRVFVFNAEQCRNEILTKLRLYLKELAEVRKVQEPLIGFCYDSNVYESNPGQLEAAMRKAEESQASQRFAV